MANAELEQINKDIQKAYEANNFKKGSLHKKAKQINPDITPTHVQHFLASDYTTQLTKVKQKEEAMRKPAKVTCYDNRARAFEAKRRRCTSESSAPSTGLETTRGRIQQLVAGKTCKCSRGTCFAQFNDHVSEVFEFMGGFSELDTHHQNICIRAAVEHASQGPLSETSTRVCWS
jgi:hypothetical protein